MEQIDRLVLSFLISGLAIGAIVGYCLGVWSGVPPRTSPDHIAKSYNDGKPIPPQTRLIKEGKRKPEIE